MGEDAAQSFFGPAARKDQLIAGKYKVIKQLGAGGMGQVVEVEHVELEKRFALKLIRPDRWDGPLEARFRREAKALARVSSPRVAEVTDFGIDPDHGPFYVMELVDGEPLDALIRRSGPMDRERALDIAIGLAEALADVHAAGIVHRDVKPGNIGICEHGPVQVRLLDFGLASSLDDRLGSGITESHRVVGSLPYMAPEQFHGEPPTPQMDLWALGVVLYEMLAGRVPFEAPSTAALIQKILAAPIPFSEAPRHCSMVLAHLLAKEPAARVRTADHAIDLLSQAKLSSGESLGLAATGQATRVDPAPVHQEVKAAPAQRSSLGIWLAVTLAGGVGLAAIAAWVFFPRAPASVPPIAAPRAPEPPPAPEPTPLPRVVTPQDEPQAIPTSEQEDDRLVRVRRARPPQTQPAVEAPATTQEPAETQPPPPSWNGTIIETRSP